jgi:hypothetical protein
MRLSRTNTDGTPLCYHPQNLFEPFLEAFKTIVELQHKTIEKVADITAVVNGLSIEQRRTADILNLLERRISDKK